MGTYWYKVMPFGLKNTGATYQRLVTKMFQEYLEKIMEVYIDDMLVKLAQIGDHFQHMSDTFKILRKYNMKLNPEKYAVGMASETGDFKQVREKEVRNFIWRNIICRFGVPKEIKRLEESKGKWPEVLPGLLWAYRITAKTSTGETLLSRVYGTEALFPVEIGEPSTRYTHATAELNEEEMRMNLDLLEERRKAALIRLTTQKQMIEQYYNRKANMRYFKTGDFILKKVFQSTKAANSGKLSPNCEVPYRVQGIARKGAYELETMDGKILPTNCSVIHLKKYYF
ncbi:uncharacterized protein LOC142177402 [Nicotiana tabacum]|uniref:Uncharacterized protein LOC142177402 n=1 Tax=Nicotiana tabacum TaxID=4097 RepID=A0AC58TXM2_TOBAC